MKSTAKFSILILGAVAVVFSLFLNRQQENPIEPSKSTSLEPEAPPLSAGRVKPESLPTDVSPGQPESFDLPPYARISSGEGHEDWMHMQMLDTKIGFTSEDIQVAQEIYTRMYESRILHEVSIAKIERSADESISIEIPRYDEFGQKLEESFYKSLAYNLGEKKTTDAYVLLAEKISFGNAFWGNSTQQIKITPLSEPDREFRKIVHHTKRASILGDYITTQSTMPESYWGSYQLWNTALSQTEGNPGGPN